MIGELNRFFVPVTSSNYDTGDAGQAPPAEKAERQRLYHDFLVKKLGVGDVHVYVMRPDGSSLRGLDIGNALAEGKLFAFLEDVRKELNPPAGTPSFPPHPASAAPSAPADSMILYLVARADAHGAWHEFPSENWIVLSADEWKQFLPPEPKVNLHDTWQVPRAASDKLLTWFLPQTEEISLVSRSRIDQGDLHMTITAVQNGVARARIEGPLKMMHTFYPHKPANDLVSAKIVGYMDFVPGEGRIQRLRLITEKATYVDQDFNAALRSVSRETLDAQK